MLLQLFIKNIALIDQIELSFGKGLHVMTGETGAGKSIVVDAMSLILGGRADRDLIRTGCDKAYAEGLFDISDCPAAARWLQTHEIDADEGTVTLSREINQSGRSICRIQGVGMPLTMLRELAGTLMDLHGQHEHQSLLEDKNHLSCLDAMGDEAHAALMRATGQAYQEYHDAVLAYKRLKQESAHREERLQELQEQEQELSAANLIGLAAARPSSRRAPPCARWRLSRDTARSMSAFLSARNRFTMIPRIWVSAFARSWIRWMIILSVPSRWRNGWI